MPTPAPRSTVFVVIDPNCGDRLPDLIGHSPAWVAMSETNAPVVRGIWAQHPHRNHLDGVTGFNHDADATGESALLGLLDTIELHHGPYSSEPPCTVLRVLGASPTGDVRAALAELDFTTIEVVRAGFIARRSVADARRLRD